MFVSGTTIKTTCDFCGEINLSPEDLLLDPDNYAYHFVCPRCLSSNTREANERVFVVLLAAGTPVVRNDEITEKEIESFVRQLKDL